MTLLTGDCVALLATLDAESLDACVTDPPYDLTDGGATGFMGLKWDGSGVAFRKATWEAVYRVLKPGAHLLAFGGTRTYHRMTCAIEDAGFEIRDSIHWIYGTGFPKSLDVSKAIDKAAGAKRKVLGVNGYAARRPRTHGKEGVFDNKGPHLCGPGSTVITEPSTDAAKNWAGWGTALKPAHEPIVLARKPFPHHVTVAENVEMRGTGALNIDATRIEPSVGDDPRLGGKGEWHIQRPQSEHTVSLPPKTMGSSPLGRWPANVILSHAEGCERAGEKRGDPNGHGIYAGSFPRGDGRAVGKGDAEGLETVEVWRCAPDCPVAELDRQSGVSRSPESYTRTVASGNVNVYSAGIGDPAGAVSANYGDSGGASRFFYVAKASRTEREQGCEALPERTAGEVTGGRKDGSDGLNSPRAGAGRTSGARNFHPCVKPVALMRYLVRLITPPGGTVVDPFMGSGTTGLACQAEGFDFIGMELSPEYVEIARVRLGTNAPLSDQSGDDPDGERWQ